MASNKIISYKKKMLVLFAILMLAHLCSQAQTNTNKRVSSKLYFSVLKVGYIEYSSNVLKGGQAMQTCAEYRFNTNRGYFLRANFDTYESGYEFKNQERTHLVKGKTYLSDFILGGGYRIRFKNFGTSILLQGGTTSYTKPETKYENEVINIGENKCSMPISRVTLGLAYYLDPKVALVGELFHSYYCEKKDFWNNDQNSMGISIGIVAALF